MNRRELSRQERAIYYFWLFAALTTLPLVFALVAMMWGDTWAENMRLGAIGAQIVIYMVFPFAFLRSTLPVNLSAGLVTWCISFALSLTISELQEMTTQSGLLASTGTLVTYFMIPILLWEFCYHTLDRWEDAFKSLLTISKPDA